MKEKELRIRIRTRLHNIIKTRAKLNKRSLSSEGELLIEAGLTKLMEGEK